MMMMTCNTLKRGILAGFHLQLVASRLHALRRILLHALRRVDAILKVRWLMIWLHALRMIISILARRTRRVVNGDHNHRLINFVIADHQGFYTNISDRLVTFCN